MRNCLLMLALIGLLGTALAAPLQTLTLQDHLNRDWTDEVVHFPLDVPGKVDAVSLLDDDEKPQHVQLTDLKQENGRTTGTLWTVASLRAGRSTVLHLQAGAPKVDMPPAARVVEDGANLVLKNDRIMVQVPRWPGIPAQPLALAKLPPPFRSIAKLDGPWLTELRWTNDGAPLLVKEAVTTVRENGPVRAVVEQRFTLTDGRAYRMTLTLAYRQEALFISEDSTIDADKAALHVNLRAGLEADQVLWYDSYYERVNGGENRDLTKLNFDLGERDRVLFKMSPWSFWWNKDRAQYAGFASDIGGETMVGVLLTHPSRWQPDNWDGFPRTEVPVTVGANDRFDLTFGLLAMTRKREGQPDVFVPLHREWMLTAVPANEYLKKTGLPLFRKQLIKYSEFPLDEVKDYGFDFTPVPHGHPMLFCTKDDIARARKQAQSDPLLHAEVMRTNIPGLEDVQRNAWEHFYREWYVGQGLSERLPTAYLGLEDPVFAQAIVATVRGLQGELIDTFLNNPVRPSLGGYGPWFSGNILELLRLTDLVTGTGALTEREERQLRDTLVFAAHQLNHPDYWNNAHGLCSANPNMTSSIILPKGLLGLYLDGHPEAPLWLKDAKAELRNELDEWIAPGGAWVESPGYQSASLDGMFLLAQALKNVKGEDYFADKQFKDMMEYYGYLSTPPDVRFPSPARKAVFPKTPMVLPSIGDTFAGFITPFNGWMACATAKSDPAYSARQQFFWRGQGSLYGGGGRAAGLVPALTDAELPTAPPVEPSRSFPGFGNVMRTSWTEPKATYLCHRTGPNYHHYHADYGTLVFYSKGAPLCTDFGNLYQPARRSESRYHSVVHHGDDDNGTGAVLDFASLRRTLDYSAGTSNLGGGGVNLRRLLLVKSDDPLGANYVITRDTTQGIKATEPITWSLWCLAKPWEDPTAPKVDIDKDMAGLDDDEPAAEGPKDRVHFTGQFGVDLDIHVLSPKTPKLETVKNWSWTQYIYVWGPFDEAMASARISKLGDAEDFFTVLYPRAKGQPAAETTPLGDGKGVQVTHMEGTDYVLFAPKAPGAIAVKDVKLAGEIAFARRYANGAIRLAVLRGDAAATLGAYTLRSTGPAAVEIVNGAVTGESSGDAHAIRLTVPTPGPATLDGKPYTPARDGQTLVFTMPAGYHAFTIGK
jgi:hypothetical protein